MKEWKEILTKAGHIEVPDCKHKVQKNEIIFWIPRFPPGSLAHKGGSLLSPNSLRKVVLKSDGIALARARDCGEEIEKRLLRQYWERF